MIRIRILITCCLGFLALATTSVAAPKKPIQPAPDGQRFLFIVETSSATGRTQAETEAALFELIGSGVNEEMRPGDTYGLWVYNKEIKAGEFPMQIWDSRNSSQLGTIAAAYISEREFEGSGDVKRLMSTVQNVVHAISNLNIFIISNGDSPMIGTPFDKAVNADYKAKRKERKEAKKPFITTMVARDGWIIESSVVVAGTPIRLPARKAPVIAEKKPPAPATNLVASTTPAVTNEVVAVTPPPAPKKVMQIVTRTNAPTESAGLASTVPSSPSPEPVATNSAAVSLAEVSKPTPAPVLVAETSAPDAAPAAAPISQPAPTSSHQTETAAVQEPVPLESALAALLPKPITVAAREKSSGTGSETPTPAVQAAVLPTVGGFSPFVMLAFGGVLLAAAVFLMVIVFRRPRVIAQGSLITQSMNQR